MISPRPWNSPCRISYVHETPLAGLQFVARIVQTSFSWSFLQCNACHPDISVAAQSMFAHHSCSATRVTVCSNTCQRRIVGLLQLTRLLMVGFTGQMTFEAGSHPSFQPFVWRFVWHDAQRHGWRELLSKGQTCPTFVVDLFPFSIQCLLLSAKLVSSSQ